MRRPGPLVAVLAFVLAGCGSPQHANTAAPSLRDACLKAREKILKRHPNAYVAECNSGTGTLPIP